MKHTKRLCFLLLATWFFGSIGIQAESSMHIQQEGGNISADIKEAPLKNVLEFLQNENEFWFRGEEDLLSQNVSARFEDEEFIQGLRRILLNINHAMMFDENGNLEGIFIAGISLAKNIDGMVINRMTDLPVQDQSPPVRESPGKPSFIDEKPVKPDDEQKLRGPSPSDNKPAPDFLEKKGPGAGKPPGEFPDSGKKPKIGPGSKPQNIILPPMGGEQSGRMQ